MNSASKILGLAVMILLARPGVAKEKNPPTVASPAEVKAGRIGLLTAPQGMSYFLRVPKKYDATAGARLIVFLHGSNMNGLEYLRSFEAKRWAEDALLCCPNGPQGNDPFGANNFGFDSAPQVAEVVAQVKASYKTTVSYVGGHSQGAFLTYSVILNYPQEFHGAFPIAGDCWLQNEPNLWSDRPEILTRQRQIALAVIHGQKDPVIAFRQGQHAYDCFVAMGWTRLRLFAPKELDHRFMLAPVAEALEWLDAMNGREEKQTNSLAAKWAKAGEWGWCWHAAEATPMRRAAIRQAAETAATQALPQLLEAKKGEPKSWLPLFTEFWRIHGETAAAQPVLNDYLEQRAKERGAAEKMLQQAMSDFRADQPQLARAKLAQLLTEAPHTYEAVWAARQLAEER
jgi:poly(3-hydroxybutyrate) depolymerase